VQLAQASEIIERTVRLTCTDLHILAHIGTDWHILAQTGTDLYSLVQPCTDWYKLV
jgi:hypothetical protein